jgi:N-carbamoyl-L-amino-acid hydrolase
MAPPDPTAALQQAVETERAFVVQFFDRLAEQSRAPAGGITRDTYGPGENWGHRVFHDAAVSAGFNVDTDAACNTYARWPTKDPAARTILMGSHLDSVPSGGNFDGAAGALAGLVAMRVLRDLGMTPRCSLAAMGVRAEESVWFEVSYIGSRLALGTLPETALDGARRIDTGRSLATHIAECGGDLNALRAGHRSLDPATLAGFVEVHIEQAPSLVESNKAVGICTGIPGNFRYPNARIIGQHGHVGTPRRFRHDAMMAGAAFAAEMDAYWAEREAEGTPLAMTFGRFHTDGDHHGLTTVPGLFHFSLDVRAYDESVLTQIGAEMTRIIARLENRYKVTFEMGARAAAPVGTMAPDITTALTKSAERHGVTHMPLGSPASHDAAAFAAAGVPTAMIFVRNENGSHNPAEAMEIDDFLSACTVLVDWLAHTWME